MKTNYFFTKKTSIYSILGVLALMATSCGSYQNTPYYDNDGVYGSTEKPKQKAESNNNNSGYYKDYFSSLNKENEQVFTDVDKYSTYNDTLKKVNSNQNTTEVQNTTGYAGWGSNPDNVTVNVYNSGWGYNSWYGPSWGYYGGGYYGNSWGYNGWYGNSWGYSPSWSWGWNSWYGPSWYGGYGYYPYGYGYYPYGYGYYGNNWGWNNGSLGHNYAYSGGRRNSNYISGGTYGSPNRSMSGNGGRSSLGGNRVVGEPSSMPRSYSNTGTPRSSYSPRTSEYVSPRPTTPNNNYNTPRSYTPSSTTSSPRSYTPSTPRSYDSPRSYTPSGGSYGGGGGSYGGGGGGGRSGGGGGRR